MYHDLFVRYSINDTAGLTSSARRSVLKDGWSVELSVLNVFNKLPPFDAYEKPFYVSQLGSIGLRAYRLALKKSF